ncbi:MAG: glycerol-3-phosphate 1-O-acyltransferase PlsY [Chthoniobacteraceae bacterium]
MHAAEEDGEGAGGAEEREMSVLAEIDPQNAFAARFFWLKAGGLIVMIGYFLGSIPFGYIIAKMSGVDIREHGSGNIGATNVMRVLGKGPGYTAFVLDALKGLAAVLVAKYIADYHSINIVEVHQVYIGDSLSIERSTYFIKLPEAIGAVMAAIACIIGHNFPVWLGFKGGKGMATSLGVLIGMIPLSAAICLGLWVAVFLTTRYVSLASIAASIALPVATVVLLMLGYIHGWPYFYFTVAACILAVWRHRPNIVRLMNGTENRFVKKPKEDAPREQAE